MNQDIFITDGAEGRSAQALQLPHGQLAWMSIKGPKRNDHRDALGIRILNDAVAFSIADGVSLDRPDSAEIAALAVRTALDSYSAEAEAQLDPTPNRWHIAARGKIRTLQGTKKGATTAISGVILPDHHVHANLIGDAHSGLKSTSGPLFAFPHPALTPQTHGTRSFWEWAIRSRDLSSEEKLRAEWNLARVPSDKNAARSINFLDTESDHWVPRWNAKFSLSSGDWFLAGSDGLGLRTQPSPWMDKINEILNSSDDPQAVIEALHALLTQISPDNATALVFRAR